jgi:Predicted transcriptional regulator
MAKKQLQIGGAPGSALNIKARIMGIRVCLEEVLKDRGMTSKELCGLVNITEANLSVLRSGKAKGVRFHTINRICYFLNCDVGDILKFDGKLEEDGDVE